MSDSAEVMAEIAAAAKKVDFIMFLFIDYKLMTDMRLCTEPVRVI